jgi:D-lactate dehydrogenase (cytochrome)
MTLNPTDTKSALQLLETILPAGQLLTDPIQLLAYEMDAGLMDRAMPDGVVFPTTPEEVAQLSQWASQHNVPLIARAVGTGLAGGAVAHGGGIIVAFSRMNKVLELDVVGRRAVVQPNVVNQKFGALVNMDGLYYPPDPASGRTSAIGGNIGTNAGGPHCFKFGVTTNYVTGLDVVLADGRQLRLGGKSLDAPEYDLTGLLVGSEGTLALVTAAYLRLVRNPPGVKTLMAVFDSVETAGEAVSAIIARGLVPATMEMMDRQIMRIIEDYTHAGLPVDSEAVLILEVDGYPTGLSPQIEEISALVKQHHARDVKIAHTPQEREAIWFARKSAAGALARLAPAYYLVDGTVPRSQLANALHEINELCYEYELKVGYVFHAGDGNLHPLILIPDPTDKKFAAHVHEAGRKIVQICIDKDGSITGEHGVGLEKRDYMPMMYSLAELRTMQDIKEVFDPQNIINPGKVLPLDIPVEVDRPAPHPPAGETFSPASALEAAAAMRYWNKAETPITVRIQGGGSKSGWMAATDMLLTTDKLSDIRHYAREDFYVTVGAGTTLAELQEALAPDNMWAPLLSPWREATIGGIVAANFNAPLRMRYGGLRDLVLTATVAMPEGRVIRAGRPVVKNVAGYDLPKLFVGSYGTLGLITEVTLKVAPLPRRRASLIVPIDDLTTALELGQTLHKVCLVTSSLLLVPGKSVTGVSTRFALIFTSEGIPEDVMEELSYAEKVILTASDAALFQSAEVSGAHLWSEWLGDESGTTMRLGVSPSDLAGLVQGLDGEGNFIADLPNGLLYLRRPDIKTAHRVAAASNGYSVVISAPPNHVALADAWGNTPYSLPLMRKLKQKWDGRGFLNPNVLGIDIS